MVRQNRRVLSYPFGCILRFLGVSWASLRTLLGPLGGLLGGSWQALGASWGLLGSSWEPLGASWEPLGASWEPLGSLLGPSEGQGRGDPVFWRGLKALWGAPGHQFWRFRGVILKVFASRHALPCFLLSGLIFSCLVNTFSVLSRPVVSCLVFSGHMSDMRFTS